MNNELWQALGTIVALLVIGGYNGYRSHRAEKASKRAEAATQEVAGAVGNGFAAELDHKLARIEAKVDEAGRMATRNHDLLVNHLEAHANAVIARITRREDEE